MSACYTEEELLWAAERLKYDEKLDQAIQAKTQNPFFLLPPIDRIIKRSRQIRRQLAEGLLSEWDVSKLVQDVPELSWSDFQRGGFDYEDRPLYRYAPGASVSEEARAMQLLHGRGNE